MHSRWALGWLTGLIVVIAMIGLGCEGGDGGGGDGTPSPMTGTATLSGTVVAADDVQTKLGNALITIEGTGRQGTSAANGTFTIANLPAGTWTVNVQTPQSAEYGSATADVPLAANQTTHVNFAVLPIGTATPTQILLDPTNVTIDLNGRVTYHTQLVGPTQQALSNLVPTWVVSGGVGTITPQGVFTASTVGSGQVQAFAGDAMRAGTVVVVAPRPPQITSFHLTPRSLPATGGDVFISAAIADGDGVFVNDVTVEIFAPGDNIIPLAMQVTNPQTAVPCTGLSNCWLDASFGVTYRVPANDNQPSPDGVQAEENYSARLTVRDTSGMTSQSPFIDFTVQGIDAPPEQPPI